MALYHVDETDGSLSEIPETSLSGEGMRERGDLQRWLRDFPGALEPDLFVLTEEYSDWEDGNRSIDLLALDGEGRLVVIELKRDEGAFMDLQAIRYAAMVAHMTFAQAVDAHDRHLQARGIEGDARERILEHLGGEAGDEPEIESGRPRILLAARDFQRELTTSVLWLRDSGIDIRCVRLLPYRIDDHLVLDVTQVIPLPEAEEYIVRVRERAIESEPRKYPVVEWTARDVERLALTLTNPRLAALIDLLAAEPDGWISLAAIVERSSETQPQIQGLFARFTRIVRTEFGRGNWPLLVEGRSSEPGGAQLVHYWMTGEVAAWWKAARGAAGEG